MSAAKLPPRKRARTAEEKEQRRVERVIRNRRAAHASREKKRRHVETLEKYVKSLELAMNSNQKLYNDVLNLLPKDADVKQFLSVTKPEDLNGNDDIDIQEGEDEEEEEEVKRKKSVQLKINNSQHEEYLGLVSPPQTNPESVFKLPEGSILEQNYSPLFDDEEENVSLDIGSNLSIYTTEEMEQGQETQLTLDPLFGLFDSVHPAVM